MPTKKNVTARKPSALKRTRQTIKARARNFSNRTQARTVVKDARAAIAKKEDNIKVVVEKASSTLDKVAKKNIIHRNKAARLKSRLSAAAKKASAK